MTDIPDGEVEITIAEAVHKLIDLVIENREQEAWDFAHRIPKDDLQVIQTGLRQIADAIELVRDPGSVNSVLLRLFS